MCFFSIFWKDHFKFVVIDCFISFVLVFDLFLLWISYIVFSLICFSDFSDLLLFVLWFLSINVSAFYSILLVFSIKWFGFVVFELPHWNSISNFVLFWFCWTSFLNILKLFLVVVVPFFLVFFNLFGSVLNLLWNVWIVYLFLEMCLTFWEFSRFFRSFLRG